MSTGLTNLIKVKNDTYERPSNRRKKNDIYDDITRNLLDVIEEKEKSKK